MKAKIKSEWLVPLTIGLSIVLTCLIIQYFKEQARQQDLEWHARKYVKYCVEHQLTDPQLTDWKTFYKTCKKYGNK